MNPFHEQYRIKKGETHIIHIWMAGDYDAARHVCRTICSEKGACYSISKTDYIYSGGEEAGFVVNLINYPRFPKKPKELMNEARLLGKRLADYLGQGSYTITSSIEPTEFHTRRKQD